jgi:hypothetical protein
MSQLTQNIFETEMAAAASASPSAASPSDQGSSSSASASASSSSPLPSPSTGAAIPATLFVDDVTVGVDEPADASSSSSSSSSASSSASPVGSRAGVAGPTVDSYFCRESGGFGSSDDQVNCRIVINTRLFGRAVSSCL